MPAPSREKMVHEQRLELKLKGMPSYVVEYVRSKRRAKYSSSTLLGYVHEFYKFFEWLQHEGISGVEQIKNTSIETLEKLSKENAELYKDEM
ncbi:hypothetical protein NDK43_27435 [Neobacillus pocheonensis]|uniref:Core-binding (CB) domain-containing protein n=1 Tax=Neobacillus pocheonensis TaxID=363869 RepID=A0ABT0WIE9_9BACI|nr:hypothetical protein [Neobacillus pocheonensis]